MRVLCQATKTASWRCGAGLAACAMPLREARAAGGRRQQLGVGAQPHCFGTPGPCRCERENGVVPRLTVSGSQCACTTTTTSEFRRSGTDAAEAAAERNRATRAALGTRASAGGRPWQEGEAGVRRVMANGLCRASPPLGGCHGTRCVASSPVTSGICRSGDWFSPARSTAASAFRVSGLT